jgi:hypothetical protein
MIVRDARDAARNWMLEEARDLPGFHGAFFAGSITSASDNVEFPTSSDVDIKVVMDDPSDTGGPQKFVYQDVILDVSYGSSEDFQSPEMVLGNYYTAVHFVTPSIILDPSGNLTAIQSVVAQEYARRVWVRRRCEHARQQFEEALTWLSPDSPVHDQVLAWLFPIFFTPPMVLVPDLRNPTHRRGFATMGQVLARYGHVPLHERMLGIVGSEAMSRAQVERLLAACAEAFDAAQAIRTTPFLLASNLSDFARPIAIGGAEELVADHHHREAVPWTAFIHTLCQTALHNDASDEVRARFTPGYEHLLGELGISSYDDRAERVEQLRQVLPELWGVTEEIIATNPAIRD